MKKVIVKDEFSFYFDKVAEVVEVIQHKVSGELYKVQIGNVTFILRSSLTEEVK